MQSKSKSRQVHVSPGQTESQVYLQARVFNLCLLGTLFGNSYYGLARPTQLPCAGHCNYYKDYKCSKMLIMEAHANCSKVQKTKMATFDLYERNLSLRPFESNKGF